VGRPVAVEKCSAPGDEAVTLSAEEERRDEAIMHARMSCDMTCAYVRCYTHRRCQLAWNCMHFALYIFRNFDR
jgi:hypothetical protein